MVINDGKLLFVIFSPCLGNFVPKFYLIVGLVLHLVLSFSCVLWSSLKLPSYLDNGNPTLLESFDLFVHDFNSLFDEVQLRVNLNFIKWNDKHIVGKELHKITHREYVMHIIKLLG